MKNSFEERGGKRGAWILMACPIGLIDLMTVLPGGDKPISGATFWNLLGEHIFIGLFATWLLTFVFKKFDRLEYLAKIKATGSPIEPPLKLSEFLISILSLQTYLAFSMTLMRVLSIKVTTSFWENPFSVLALSETYFIIIGVVVAILFWRRNLDLFQAVPSTPLQNLTPQP